MFLPPKPGAPARVAPGVRFARQGNLSSRACRMGSDAPVFTKISNCCYDLPGLMTVNQPVAATPKTDPAPPPSELEDDPDAAPTSIPWRRNLIAIWFVQILAIVGFSLRTPFLPFYIGELGVPSVDGQTFWSGIINASGAGVMALTAPLWGMLADRRGRRMMLIRAAFAGACTVALMSLAVAPWQLLALRLVEGGFSGTVTAATALVAVTTPRRKLGFALGLLQTAVFAGSSLGPLIGGLLADRIGMRQTFWVAGGMLATAATLALLLVREQFTPTPRAAFADDGGSRWRQMRVGAAAMFGPVVVMLILALFVIRFASMAVQPIIPLFVESLSPGATDTASLAGLVLGVLGVTSALSSTFLGRFGDQHGHRKILIVSIFAAGALYLPMAIAHSPWQLALLFGLFGVAAGGLIPAANAIIANRTPNDRRATMYGITASAASFGAFFGPLVGAAIAIGFGFPAAFITTGIMLLLLGVVILRGIPATMDLEAPHRAKR